MVIREKKASKYTLNQLRKIDFMREYLSDEGYFTFQITPSDDIKRIEGDKARYAQFAQRVANKEAKPEEIHAAPQDIFHLLSVEGTWNVYVDDEANMYAHFKPYKRAI